MDAIVISVDGIAVRSTIEAKWNYQPSFQLIKRYYIAYIVMCDVTLKLCHLM